MSISVRLTRLGPGAAPRCRATWRRPGAEVIALTALDGGSSLVRSHTVEFVFLSCHP